MLIHWDFKDLPWSNKRSPPPAVILRSQLEIRQRNRNAGRDTQQNNKDHAQYAIKCVLVTAPKRREYVVQLDTDGWERKEASNNHVAKRATIPGNGRNLAANVLCAARLIKRLRAVLAENAPDYCERISNRNPDERQNYDSCEWQGLGAAVRPRNTVYEGPGAKERHRVDTGSEVDIPHPRIAVHLLVGFGAHIASDARGEGVENEGGRA